MKLANGPRIDATCANVWMGDQQRIVISGGWNNVDMAETEYFQYETKKWKTLGDNETGAFEHALPFGLRSSRSVELNKIPWLMGGVTCQG